MKLRSFVVFVLVLVLAACGSSDGYESFAAEDYDITLMNDAGEMVELFAEPQKTLILYFTGVG